MENQKLTIGKLAKSAGVGVETIRFYERKGLLTQPKKSGAFRVYPDSAITIIRFIKRSQELGFTLKEAQDILQLNQSPKARCQDVMEKAEQKIEEIDQKIKDLKKMKKSLTELTNACSNPDIPLRECASYCCF